MSKKITDPEALAEEMIHMDREAQRIYESLGDSWGAIIDAYDNATPTQVDAIRGLLGRIERDVYILNGICRELRKQHENGYRYGGEA